MRWFNDLALGLADLTLGAFAYGRLMTGAHAAHPSIAA